MMYAVLATDKKSDAPENFEDSVISIGKGKLRTNKMCRLARMYYHAVWIEKV